MRHKRKGRVLGRSPSHRKAMMRNMASSLFLTERNAEDDENQPKVKGRIITTVHKAKEVRPLVERCITIARRALDSMAEAARLASSDDRNSAAWIKWRKSDAWREWNQAAAPAVAARRHALRLLGDKEAVRILFDEIAPRFADRPGGYTRVVRLAKPRLGDAGERAILELVGVRDRQAQKSQAPTFEGESPKTETPKDDILTDDILTDDIPTDDGPASEQARDGSDSDSDSQDKAEEAESKKD